MDFQAQEDFQLEDRVDAGLTYGVASQAHAMNAEEGGNPYAGWTADELIAGMEGVRTQIGQLKKEVQAVSSPTTRSGFTTLGQRADGSVLKYD